MVILLSVLDDNQGAKIQLFCHGECCKLISMIVNCVLCGLLPAQILLSNAFQPLANSILLLNV